MAKDESADERARAIEWLREIEASAAELVEVGDLLFRAGEPAGLRDRALIGVMVFTFASVSAACGINVADIFQQQRRLWVRLKEKGGKFHEMPCHHTLEGYLAEYLERAPSDRGRAGPALPGH